MAVLNFPDPAGQSPTNTFGPASTPHATSNGVTYVWTDGSWSIASGSSSGQLLDKDTADSYYVEKAGDNMTGNLTLGTDKITLDATSGNAEFADDVVINGLTVGLGAGDDETNTVVGNDALSSNTTGDNNTAVGKDALLNNTTGQYNTALGVNTLKENTEGEGNIAVGQSALQNNTTGIDNIVIGVNALLINTTGSHNTVIGRQAGFYIEGSNNTILGAYEGTTADSSLNDTVIISAGPTERMRIDENGDTTFYGNVSTPGVVFGTPAGNATSKTLDDYEEGTFTPVLRTGVWNNN